MTDSRTSAGAAVVTGASSGTDAATARELGAQRLAELIRTVHAGNRYVDQELAADAISAGNSPLPAREAEVPELAADGAPHPSCSRAPARTR